MNKYFACVESGKIGYLGKMIGRIMNTKSKGDICLIYRMIMNCYYFTTFIIIITSSMRWAGGSIMR